MPAFVRIGRAGRRTAVLLLAALAATVTVVTVAPVATTTAGATRFVTHARATGGPPAPAPAPAAGGPPAPAGLGPGWAAQLAGHAQVVIASGTDSNSPHAAVTEWQRGPGGWVQLGEWSAWNGSAGWTTTPAEGRPQSPVGVFGLTDAGGYAPNPGSSLPYDHSRSSYSLIFNGVRAFNHVIAINYNRVSGAAPANQTRPMGYAAGGGFWIHTQHNSGTNGCIGIPDTGVVQLQKTLDPAAKPVIVMGPATVLAH
jgi:L,D-peptidoglycan transpeptidase YkuD (ErfK/YbiS/YcfS/YnhG family)